MTTATEPITLPDVLKARTQELHTTAERHSFQRSLMKGELSINQFAASQAQYMLVHHALESHLRTLVQRDPSLAGVIEPHHYREALYVQDVEALGLDPEAVTALPATESIIRQIENDAATAPHRLLGYLYVLEGSTNGSQYIAAGLRRHLLADGRGLRSLDPHGDAQRERWGRFRAGLSAIAIDESATGDIVESAQRMFAYAIELMDSLQPAVSPLPRRGGSST